MYHLMICTYYLSDGVSMVTETSGTRTGTLDSEYENIGIIPIYFVLQCPLGIGSVCGGLLYISLSGTRPCVNANFKINSRHISRWVVHASVCLLK